ncbi:MAG: hypothetical protein KDK07_07225 [Bauldia sp.]|nr:hypothetical protein [Bauldia sp.]
MSEWTRSGKAVAEIVESRALIWGLIIAGIFALPLGAALSFAGLMLGLMLAPSGAGQAGQGEGAAVGVSLIVGIATVPISVPILAVALRNLARKGRLGTLQLTATFVATSSVIVIALLVVTAGLPSASYEIVGVALWILGIGIVFGGSEAISFMVWIVKKHNLFKYGPMPLPSYVGVGIILILLYQLLLWQVVANNW